MRPSVVLDMKRSAVRESGRPLSRREPASSARCCMAPTGMAATPRPVGRCAASATLLDLGDLEEELKSLLGVDVDLLTPGDLPPKFRAKVLAEAQPI